MSRGEREEAEVERLLAQPRTVSRANVAAVISSRGGVGKTTCAFAVANLIADRLRLRVAAIDADPELGTLAALTPERVRCPRSLADLLADIERIDTAAQLRGYVTALPSGLHVLGASDDLTVAAQLDADAYGELVALLGTFYDLVVLDLGTGMAHELPQLAITRADQLIVVTTPERPATTTALDNHADQDRTTVACNQFHSRRPADLRELERRLSQQRPQQPVAIPHDGQLAAMLDTGTYQLDSLERPTRLAIKRLGLRLAQGLV